MKRVIVGLILLVAVVVFGGNYYYTQKIAEKLDQASMMVAGMGGDLEYRDIDITLKGEVRIEGLFMRMPGMGGALNMDQILVHTGNPLGVHALAMDIRERRLPKTLGVSFEGVRLPMSANSQLGNGGGFDTLAAAGCGDRSGFGVNDLMDMGYSGLVVDTRVDYRFIGGGQLLNVEMESDFEGMNRIRMAAELSLGANSLNSAAVGMAMTNAELLNLSLEYIDRGYAERVLAFCQEETGMNRPAYIAHHLSAWQTQLNQLGFEPGSNLTDAYRTFLNEPDQLSLTVKPSGALSAGELTQLTPDMLLAHLQTELSVNHESVGRLDLSVLDSGALLDRPVVGADESREETPAVHQPSVFESKEEPEPQPAQRRVAIDNLGRYLERDVAVQLNDGKTLEGHIQSVHELSLQFKHFRNGGYVIMPIQYRDIEAVYLR